MTSCRMAVCAVTAALGIGLLTSCSSEASDLVDDYEAGQTAGLALYKDPHPNEVDERRCQELTRRANAGDPGFEVGSSEEAKVFWTGCLQGAEGRDDEISAAYLKPLINSADD